MILRLLLIMVGLLQPIYGTLWKNELQQEFEKIENSMPGRLGVYVENTADGFILDYNASDYWYLSSVVKIPMAVALLQKVEKGEIDLEQMVVLKASDFVDGAGDLSKQQPGTSYSVRTLLEKMIKNSDSSATDILFRLMGEDEFNEHVKLFIAEQGFNPITSLLQVRYEAYGQLHENAANLTNIDYLELRGEPGLDGRLDLLVEKMGVNRSDLKAGSIFEAFDLYYETGLNSATLNAMGLLLRRLYNGELLNDKHTEYLLDLMQNISTGDRRIKAGLPPGTRFAQKTGTQIRSACNVGIIFPENRPPVIVAACAQGNDAVRTSEEALKEVGEALNKVLISR